MSELHPSRIRITKRKVKKRRKRARDGADDYLYHVVHWQPPGARGWRNRQFSDRKDGESKARAFALRMSREIMDAERTGGEFIDCQDVRLSRLVECIREERKGAKVERMRGSAVRGSINSLKRFQKFLGDGDEQRGDIRLVDITPRRVTDFQASMRSDGLSTNAVSKHLRTIKAAFTVAEAQGLASNGWNPAMHKSVVIRSQPTDKRLLSDDELDALYEASAAMGNPTWWECWLNVLYFGALRAGEAENLTWPDIDFAKRVIRIRPKTHTESTLAWRPKTARGRREIPLIPAAEFDLLRELKAEAPADHAYVFLPAARFESLRAKRDQAQAWESGEHSDLDYDAAKALQTKGRKQREWVEDVESVMPTERKHFSHKLVVEANRILCERFGDDGGTLLDDGKPTVSLHDLRRTGISMWLTTGDNPLTMHEACAFSGHSSIGVMYDNYAGVLQGRFDKARGVSEAASRRKSPRLRATTGATSVA